MEKLKKIIKIFVAIIAIKTLICGILYLIMTFYKQISDNRNDLLENNKDYDYFEDNLFDDDFSL